MSKLLNSGGQCAGKSYVSSTTAKGAISKNMSGLMPATMQVSMDEMSMFLGELNLMAPDNKGFNRYEIIQVIRADEIAEYRRNMGPVANFTSEELRIPGGIIEVQGTMMRYVPLHTVGELRDMAEEYRKYPAMYEQVPVHDITDQYQRALEWRGKGMIHG